MIIGTINLQAGLQMENSLPMSQKKKTLTDITIQTSSIEN